MKKNMIIVERRLFSSFGHERTQIVGLNELIGNKKSIVLTCHGQKLKEIPFKNKIYAELPEYDFKNESEETLDYIKKNGDAFASFIKRNKLNSKYKIIVPSARTVEIAMFTYLYKEKKISDSQNVLLRILDLSFLNNLSDSLLNEFCKLVKLNKIFLFSETEELAKIVWDSFKIRCEGNFILPVTVPFHSNVSQNKIKRNEIYIGCLGGSRKSKGFFTIPTIIKSLRMYFKKNDEDFRVTFIVQLNKDKTKRSLIFKFNEFLSRYISSSVKVKYIYGIENNIKFFELLKSVDIFLLPYSKKTYKYSGSGFITDAIFLEKPLITSQGISMRNLLTFNNAISANSPKDYSAAIIKISKNYENYAKNSKLAKKYLKKTMLEAFKKAMCSSN